MYKSPVELYVSDIKLQIDEKLEEVCYTAVIEYFPNVDKGELIRALRYDRQQYEQGYRDAIREKDLVEVVRCGECASKVHDNASDEDWCNHPGGLCCRLKDDYFCPFGERRTE